MEYERSDLCTYSKLTKELEAGSKQPEEIPIVTLWFDLDEEDRRKLGEIHSKLARLEQMKVTKYYDDSYEVESEKVDISAIEPERTVEIVEVGKFINITLLPGFWPHRCSSAEHTFDSPLPDIRSNAGSEKYAAPGRANPYQITAYYSSFLGILDVDIYGRLRIVFHQPLNAMML
ncbi:unnamed protein product [marine sediment metagenome]|uniref:Uncharacterized protein n=1 Tax=marine sediment metagenome TaxID=412755 RepID=X1T1U1_9ZZZZ